MFCKECGKEFSNEQSQVCLECGVDKGKGNNYCPFCGEHKKSENQDVCLSCGSKLKKNNTYMGKSSDKTKLVTLILWFFLGAFGVHQFYVGNNKKGILYLVLFVATIITCGIAGIVTTILLIIDLVYLLTDKMYDGDGNIIIEWT